MNIRTCSLKVLLTTILFLIMTLAFTRVSAQCDPVRDSLVLVEWYHATNGENWMENTNWLVEGQPIGNWHGVDTNEDGCVVTLALWFNNMAGELIPDLANLTELETLILIGNYLTGSIPVELTELNNLDELDLSFNLLAGQIPSEIGNITTLTRLDLSGNNLTGEIPPEIGNLIHLTRLDIRDTKVGGEIPSEISNLTNLTTLWLQNNRLTGRLPVELSNLTNLSILLLEGNLFYGCIPTQYDVFCDIENVDLSDNPGLSGGGDFAAFCAGGSGACDPTITGHVTFDENQNCVEDDLEIGLQNWLVNATSSDANRYGFSDENGDYGIYAHPGEYEVSLVPLGPYWEEICTEIEVVDVLDDPLNLVTVDFTPSALVDCPFMIADISTPFLRRCFSNTYVVNYCNLGTTVAPDAYIEVQFDELINIDSTSIPIFEQVDNTFTFELGDVAVNECGSLNIYTTVSCDAVLEQTLCTSIHIYPDSICAEISPEWSGATVAVEGSCDGNEVKFVVKNVGDGNMLENQSYIVIEDGLILLSAPTPFILNSQGEMEISFPANGSTYICEATQVDNHPVPSMPIAFVEACGMNNGGDFSTGFVTQFPEDDIAPFISIDCQEVIGAFDPNDKRAYPKGYHDEHYIESGQDIEYHIRFQNTGNDTAFTVVVEDVISPNLEMATFQRGVSSHPYHIEILGGDTLRFIFDDILLVDSFANEPASHGFVKFKISQKEDLPLETRIENTAAIYFDFNEAVITNTTWHTIGEGFIQLIATSEPFINDLKVTLMPNPVVDESIIHLSGIDFKNAQIHLFDMLGRQLKQETFQGNELLLRKGELLRGVYLFEIRIDGRRGFMGKMAVQ